MSVDGGDRDLEALLERMRPWFTRAEPRRRAELYVRGLLSDLARKNGWTLAAHAGARDATSMQRMLNAARWDTDGVRDEARRWLVECVGDWHRGTLVVDEVRFPKAGPKSVGAHRDREHGRPGNAQVAVFLAYVSSRGRALVDRELYLPQEWIGDRIRARRVGVPDDVTFADRDELATRMIKRAVESHGPTAWVVAGGSLTGTSRLRTWLQERFQAYVLPISADVPITVRDGLRVEAGRVADAVPRSSWVRVAGTTVSAVNERWALVALPGDADDARAGQAGRWGNGLLLRRPAVADATPTLYRCRFPRSVDLVELVQAARTEGAVRANVRWAGENIGLDHYQVRRYDAWYRHMTLCLIAGAYLACRAHRGMPLPG